MRRRLTVLTVCVVCALPLMTPTGAAAAFAEPAFQAQWQPGEALTPNFWGPLATAKDGQQEP